MWVDVEFDWCWNIKVVNVLMGSIFDVLLVGYGCGGNSCCYGLFWR